MRHVRVLLAGMTGLGTACLLGGCVSTAAALQSWGVGGRSGPPEPDAESAESRPRAEGVASGEVEVAELALAMVSDDAVVRWSADRRLKASGISVEYDPSWNRPRLEASARALLDTLGPIDRVLPPVRGAGEG